MNIDSRAYRFGCPSVLVLSAVLLWAAPLEGQSTRTGNVDCSSAIGGTRTVNGRKIGTTGCQIVSEKAIKSASGAPYRLLEIALSGCLEGYTVKTGPDRHAELMQFTDVPEYALAQEGNYGPYYHAVSCYTGSLEKSGITMFLPANQKDWNGKLYMIHHGGSPYPPILSAGDLLPRKPGEWAPLMGANDYAGLMIDRGYAVAYTRRSSHSSGEGDMGALLDSGEELGGKSHKFHIGLLKDWTEVAQNYLEATLKSRPTKTYWYGRSGGAAPGRLINYIPNANLDSKGRRMFDGMILDDSAGGWYMPTLFFKKKDVQKDSFAVEPDTEDQLVFDDAHRKAFVPQFDVTHLGYAGNTFVEANYPTIKRRNAKYLVDKKLTDKSRYYEVRAVSHGDAGANFPNKGWEQNLDLGGIFEALIDNMEQWVEKDVAPPVSRADVPFIGDLNGDGLLENAAIGLPEVECPTGVYYEFPQGTRGSGRTGFAPFLTEAKPALNSYTTPPPPGFDQAWLEPLNNYGQYLDMNNNKVRDTRESIEQAWQRRGLEGHKHGTLQLGEKLTQEKYQACVSEVAEQLFKDRLISEPAMKHYKQPSAAQLPTQP